MMIITALPAYGRDYKSKAKLLEDWDAGKDFINTSPFIRGTYFSKRDMAAMLKDGIKAINFRYNKQLKSMYYKL